MAYLNDTSYVQTDEEKINYFHVEQQAHAYAKEFFKEAVPYFNLYYGDTNRSINDDILPFYCFDVMAEKVAAVEEGRDYYIQGGLVTSMKQAVIRMGITNDTAELTEKLKSTIRHEICHYCLWIIDRGYKDDDLDFWCYAYMFDANPYEKLCKSDKERFKLFKRLYDSHIADIPYNFIKTLIIQTAMLHISDSKEEFERVVLDTIKQTEALFSVPL